MGPITLDQLLASRDARHEMQLSLRRQHPDKTVVCLTVVVPGSVKRNLQSLLVAHAAVEALRARFQPMDGWLTERDLPTGYEAYLITTCTKEEAKRRTCEIEENHPLGRLFDIDVLSDDGSPLSRASIGLAPRRCLLCDNEARYCMRNHTHTQEELWQRINEMTDHYAQTHHQ